MDNLGLSVFSKLDGKGVDFGLVAVFDECGNKQLKPQT